MWQIVFSVHRQKFSGPICSSRTLTFPIMEWSLLPLSLNPVGLCDCLDEHNAAEVKLWLPRLGHMGLPVTLSLSVCLSLYMNMYVRAHTHTYLGSPTLKLLLWRDHTKRQRRNRERSPRSLSCWSCPRSGACWVSKEAFEMISATVAL